MPSSALLCVRRLCLGLLTALALCGSGARAAQIEATVGFGLNPTDARFREDSWTPVTVFLTGSGARGVGQLKVAVRSGQRLTNYVRRVPLRDGNLNEAIRFAVLLSSANRYGYYGNRNTNEINIQLLLDGRKLAEKTITLPLAETPHAYNVLSLTKDGGGLPFLQRKKLGLIHRNINPATLAQNFGANNRQPKNGILPTAILRAHVTDPRALPAAPQAYEMMDAIVLGDIPLDAIAEEQITALKLYVQQGGLLLISGNGDLSRLKSSFFTEMLPVTVSGIGDLDTQPLIVRYGNRSTLPYAVLAVKGRLKPGATPLFGQASGDTLPLVTTINYGSGRVLFTSFDVTASEFRGWKSAHALWRDLLRTGNNALSPRDLLQSAGSPEYYYGGTTSNMLSDALAGKQAASTPSLLTVSMFIGLYILLLVPVSYFLLKKLDKREFAWVTAPLLILGFTGVSYAIAQSIKGGMLTVNRVVVFEGAANSDHFAGYAQMTLYSPARSGYDIAINGTEDSANRSLLPSEIYTASTQNLVSELTVEQDKTTTLRNTTIRLWDKRSFESPVSISLGGGIEARTEVADVVGGVNYRATVTNRTSHTLHDCAVVSGNTSSPIGDLAPGETKAVKNPIPWAYKGEMTLLNLAWTNSAPNNGTTFGNAQEVTPEVTQRAIRNATQTVMQNNNNNGNYNYGNGYAVGYGRAPNAFVGWFYDKTVDVQVNGKSAGGEEANMVFAHLPLPKNAPPNVRAAANPFLKKPVLELEDDTLVGGFAR